LVFWDFDGAKGTPFSGSLQGAVKPLFSFKLRKKEGGLHVPLQQEL